MKYFRMSYEEVVFNRSYINIMLLNRSIPTFNTKKGNKDNSDANDSLDNRKYTQKEYHNVEKVQHANDFFMGMM